MEPYLLQSPVILMVRVVSLKVEKSKTYDVSQNVVRIDEKKRSILGAEIGDAVIVRSNISVITAIVKSAIKNDVGKNILKLDEKQRQMLGVDDGTAVDVINYLDYKMEEEKLKPQPALLKQEKPQFVIEGDYIEGHKIEDSLIQRSDLKIASDEDSITNKKKSV